MKEYKVKRYGRDRRHQKTAATLKTVLMVLLIAGACSAGESRKSGNHRRAHHGADRPAGELRGAGYGGAV